MLRLSNRGCIAVLATLTLVVAACGKEEAATPLTDADGLLRYVPADTPYFLGALEPSPEEVFDKFQPVIEEMMEAQGEVLSVVADTIQNDPDIEIESEEEQQIILALLRAMELVVSPGSYEKAGFTRDSIAAIYGNGMLPVLRVTVADSSATDAWLSEIEAEAGQEMSTASVQGETYRFVDAESMRVVIASIDDQLVITVMPSAYSDDQLAELLGLSLPAENLADAGVLQEIADEYDYLPQFIGFIDTAGIADTFIDGPSGLDVGLFKLMEYDASAISDVCKAEFRGLAAVMPRIVTGYETLSTQRVDSSLVMEFRDDIAQGLATIPAAVPGLGQRFDGMFSFGIGADLLAARKFYEARITAIEEAPFQCELLGDLQDSVVAGREALNQPLPPIVYGFKGFLAVINDIEGFDPATRTPPESVDGSLLVAMENAPGLLALGQMMSPELYELDIQPDGKPHLLQSALLQQAGIESAWLAMSDDALAISLAEDGDSQLPGIIGAVGASPAPFLSMDMDANRYYDFVAQTSAVSTGDPGTDEIEAASAELVKMLGDIYDRLMVDILFTERGIEISMDTTLAD